MNYPRMDGVLLDLGAGPLALRWYGLMYVFGFLCFYLLGRWRIRHGDMTWTASEAAYALVWAPWRRRAGKAATTPASGPWTLADLADILWVGGIGAVIGGRLGSVLFYHFGSFLEDPLSLLRIWEGGMSFHGGLLGALAGCWLFAAKRSRRFLDVADFAAPLAPIGLGLGRIGNFINTELPGRVTELPIGVHFPCPSVYAYNLACFGEFEDAARHVSSLYQALTEGVVLFLLVWLFAARRRAAGVVSGVFLLGYGALRFLTEFLREPDPHLGFIAFDWLTTGQLLCLPMVALGAALLLRPRLKGAT